jgi:hypothetical protein
MFLLDGTVVRTWNYYCGVGFVIPQQAWLQLEEQMGPSKSEISCD